MFRHGCQNDEKVTAVTDDIQASPLLDRLMKFYMKYSSWVYQALHYD